MKWQDQQEKFTVVICLLALALMLLNLAKDISEIGERVLTSVLK